MAVKLLWAATSQMRVGWALTILRYGTGQIGHPGEGLGGPVYSLALQDKILLAGGAFTISGGITSSCVATWNGKSWKGMGSGFSEGLPADIHGSSVPTSVNGLAATPEGLVYAVGNFTKADGKSANFAAYWDGAGWQPLGSGLNRIACALAFQGEDLHIGGDFSLAGTKPSSRVALWHGNASLVRPYLDIQMSIDRVVISWPLISTGFVLQSSQDLAGGSWSSVPYNAQDGRCTSTNSLAGTTRFYRLQRE